MAEELAVRQVPQLDVLARLGTWLAYAESGNETAEAKGAAAALRLYYAQQLGLPPLAAAELSMIRGKLVVSARLLRAFAHQAGYSVERDPGSNTEICTAVIRNGTGTELGRATFTLEDARRAHLIRERSAWITHPARMLWARASANVIYDFAPHVALGMVTEEEADEIAGVLVHERDEIVDQADDHADVDGPITVGERVLTPDGEATLTGWQRDTRFVFGRQVVDMWARVRFDDSSVGVYRSDTTTPALPEPEPDVPKAEPKPDTTAALRRRMHAAFRDAGINDRGKRLTYTINVIGHQLGSSTEMTGDEVAQVIDRLTADKQAAADPGPPAEPKPEPDEQPRTKAQADRLDELTVELIQAGTIRDEDVWLTVSIIRGKLPSDLQAELGGDSWDALRDSLTRAEAGDLLDRLHDRKREAGLDDDDIPFG